MVDVIIDNEWFLNKITEPKWHYVSWTPYSTQALLEYASMSYVYAICLNSVKLSEKEICALFHQIDRSGETGTFYPAANITIMPSRRYKEYSPEQIKQHIDDVRKAQELINSDSIYWDCRFEDEKIARGLFTVLTVDEYWRGKKCFIVCSRHFSL